jgi:hypothetical protein
MRKLTKEHIPEAYVYAAAFTFSVTLKSFYDSL